MKRPPLVVGNWKMNLPEIWAERLIEELLPLLASIRGVQTAVAPPFTSLATVRRLVERHPVMLAAQNMHWEDDGAFTGEISPRMLAESSVELVILGHSERRTLFGETDRRIRRKVQAAGRHRLTPILCLGEQESERDAGRTLQVVERQLRIGLADVKGESAAELVVAYEPLWAIGTGRTATPEQVDEVHRMLREQLSSMFGAEAASQARILYGGSVTPENAPRLLSLPEVNGALVGGASLDAERFADIVSAAR